MNILNPSGNDKNKLQEFFHLFKQCSEQFYDLEALAKLSACYYREIGTKKDKNKSYE
jgi:hypothetical protein